MSRLIVAKRYAKALFEAASQEGIVDQVEQELELVVQLIKDDLEFKKFLEHPNIETDAKLEVLKTTLSNHLSPIVFKTLELIILRRREAMLPELLSSYIASANEALGQENAVVYSAYDISAEESDKIAQTFSAMTGKKIKVSHIVDASILGGLRVRIGDRLFDGSLSNKLANLEKSLL